MTPPELSLVVPCYNEATRLQPAAFLHFIATHPHVHLVMVDDGSTDATSDVIARLRADAPAAVTMLQSARRRGKGEAVRLGILAGLARGATFVGFIDADLSTPLDAVDDFLAVFRNRPSVEFVIGSRVKLMGRAVERSGMRYWLGRAFARAAAHALDLPVYDPQCGAKILRANAATAGIFSTPFHAKWIFDVELIARFLQLRVASDDVPRRDRLYELVLAEWRNRGGSKLRWHDIARAAVDLARLWRAHLSLRSPAARHRRSSVAHFSTVGE